MINWITLLLVMVFLWSVYHGVRRGFAYESGHLAAQCLNVIAGVVSIWVGWMLSNFVSSWAGTAHPGHWPHWATQIVQAWQQSPNVARMVTFAIFYLLSSSVLHAFMRPFPTYVARVIPKRIGSNRYLGGAMGALIGLARTLMVGGLIFLVTQYFSFPGLVREAGQSRVYKGLSDSIYRPWLKPFVVRELPVFAEGALQPLANNINLFAIPTPTQGEQRGVLVVPKDISQLAQSIVHGMSSPRQKAHALYEWESHHIHYDWNKYNDYVYHNKWDNQSPEQTLHTGKGVCADYALLYADMAHSVGLTVQIDEGIGGTASQNGPHAWNKVLDGTTQHWIPVDTTWGSEEDIWFDPTDFDQTHRETNNILIVSSSS